MTQTQMRFSASPAAIETTRFECIEGTAQRKEREALYENNASMLSFLKREEKAWEVCDAFTLAYASANGINPASLYLHERHGGEMFNIYAMPKLRVAMRVLNGARFPDIADSDSATLAGSVLALHAAGGGIAGKALANALNDYMNAAGGRTGYQSGATQSGSSMRALEALGIVAKDGARAWKVANPEHFKHLLAAARKAKRD